jgi:Spy/CpxP family protein refolding chaperone
MKKVTAILLAVFVLALFSAIAFADEGKGGFAKGGFNRGGHEGMQFGGMYSPKMILAMASELNLTSDQFEKIKAIEKDSPKKVFDKDAEKANREALKSEFEKDSPDEAKIADIMAKMSETRQTAIKAKIHEMLKVKAVLTKDQIDIIKKKKEEMKKKFEEFKKK